MKKKFSFTLVEVFIAFSLSAILIAFLFFYYKNANIIDAQIATAKEVILQRNYTFRKLTEMFYQIDENSPFYLQRKEDGYSRLHFSLQDQVDPDPNFAGLQKCFLDERKEGLYFIIETSAQSEKKQREEHLLSLSSKIQWLFYQIDPKTNEITSFPTLEEKSPIPLVIQLEANELLLRLTTKAGTKPLILSSMGEIPS